MKKVFAAAVLAFMAVFSAFSADFNGARYDGIAKLGGQPIDFWTVISFDNGKAVVNMANTTKFRGAYEQTTADGKTTVTITTTSGSKIVLTSSDDGASLVGKLSSFGKDYDVWVLKVSATQTASTLPDSELDAVVGSSDGYTAFVRVMMPNGALMSATSDFALNADDHTFSMTCDSQGMQKIFGKMQGKYAVRDGKIIMTDSSGKVVEGTVYDNGKYVTVPMGKSSGLTLDLILIR